MINTQKGLEGTIGSSDITDLTALGGLDIVRIVVHESVGYVNAQYGQDMGPGIRFDESAYEALVQKSDGNVGYAQLVAFNLAGNAIQTNQYPVVITSKHVDRFGMTPQQFEEMADRMQSDYLVPTN